MNKARILIADDDQAIRTVLTQALRRAGYDVKSVASAASLWQAMTKEASDLLISDVVMPDQNIFDLIPRIKKHHPHMPIIVISAQNTLSTAIAAAEQGAYDYLPKPFDLKELLSLVTRALETPRTAARTTEQDEEALPLIGRSPAMQDIYRAVARLTQNDLSVLITGESGTGKELVARALHDYGTRKQGAFIALNMAAIPKDLIESELFGHEKGAFTGAVQRQEGRFAQARGGTLFLDEIGDMPLDAQTRLLRVLQDGEYMPVGARYTISTDARIIAATHQDLRRLIAQGLFREDLFFRLNVIPLRLPPLRERREDIPLLARHFLRESVKQGLSEKIIDNAALEILQKQKWEGNVRELRNFILRIAALYTEEVISTESIQTELAQNKDAQSDNRADTQHFAESLRHYLNHYFAECGDTLPPPGLYNRIISEVERPLIIETLKIVRNNQLKAATILGLNRNTLRKKIKELDIDVK